jgi:sigma-B regulation protein RsbU (phosphoserine phosphatase)
VPLGAFAGSTYDEVTFDLAPGDVFVFCTDGVTEAQDSPAGVRRDAAAEISGALSQESARGMVDAIFGAVHEFRGDMPPNDDMTAVVLKITAAI